MLCSLCNKKAGYWQSKAPQSAFNILVRLLVADLPTIVLQDDRSGDVRGRSGSCSVGDNGDRVWAVRGVLITSAIAGTTGLHRSSGRIKLLVRAKAAYS